MKILIFILFFTTLFFSCQSNKTEKYQEEEVIQKLDTLKIEQIKIQTH
jgi:hypothetical protein